MTRQNIRLYISVAILFTLFCCTNSTKDVLTVNLDDGGKAILPFIKLGKDTIIEGMGKYYDSKGRLKKNIPFHLGKKNGWALYFDSNSNIISKMYFKDDLLDGTAFEYNDKKTCYLKYQFIKGERRVGQWLYPSGKLKLLRLFRNDSTFFYEVSYEENGKKTGETGNVFADSLYVSCNRDSIKLGKQIVLSLLTTQIPNYSTYVEVGKFNANKKMVDLKYDIPIKNYWAIDTTYFDKPGHQMIAIAGEIRDEKNNLIKVDTMYRWVNVIR